MRFLFFLFFSGYSLMGAAQKYHCEYKEMILFPMPDSALKSLKTQMEDQGLPSEAAEKLVKQLSLPGILGGCLRKVDAGPDSTFILVTKDEAKDGNAQMNIPDKRLLFRKGEIYQYDAGEHKFITETVLSIRRIFKQSAGNKIMLNHSCTVYATADSTCRIWVTEDLPAYINPGIWVGNIRGAILAYELKEKGRSIHTEIAKIE